MKHFFRGLLMSLIFGATLQAQITDTMFVLPEFSVKETRLHEFNAGHFIQRIDTVYIQLNPAASLGDVLFNNSSLHVDAYGVGSTSVSARGLGAKRTPVIWNGFNLQSINGHDVDVATIQAFMVDNIQIETGSSSALFGSGAAGGVVYIDNKPLIGSANQTQINLNMGSYGKYMGGSSIRWGNGDYKGTIRLFYEAADNDFDYKADYLNTKTKEVTHLDTAQVNAARHQFGVMSDNTYQINEHNSIDLHLWFQDVNRQIAPTIKDVVGKKTADALQVDQNYRAAAQWNHRHGIWNTAVRSAIITNQIHYTKPSSGEDTRTSGNSWISEAEATCHVAEGWALNMGAHYTYEDCESSSYDEWHERNRAAVFASSKYYFAPTGTRFTVNGRLEHIEMEKFPFTWTIGLDQNIWGPVSLIAQAGNSYRVPSFNDLYWESSYAVGNPDLKPEEGTNYEVGLKFSETYGLLNVEASTSTFWMDMKNWMSWGAREDGIYTVLNQDSAKIRGVELMGGLTLGNKSKHIGLNGSYTYLDARDPKTDNYIIYVPMHKGSISLSGVYNGFQLMASRTESSKMYIRADNSDQLPGYIIYDCALYKSLPFKTCDVNIGFKVQNLTDEQYQTRQYYPMPGRQFLLSLALRLM